MPSEIEYKFIGDYIEELSKTENPSSADKTLVSNETDGPRYVPANPEALTNVATEADMTADAKLRVMTPAGEKQLPANLVAKAGDVESIRQLMPVTPTASSTEELVVEDDEGHELAKIDDQGNFFAKKFIQNGKELQEKIEEFATETTASSTEELVVEDDEGNELAKIDDQGNFFAKKFIQNGKELQEKFDDISEQSSGDGEFVCFEDDEGNELAKIDDQGVSADGFLDIDGNGVSGLDILVAPIQPLFLSEAKRVASAVRALKSASSKCFCAGLLTDTHHQLEGSTRPLSITQLLFRSFVEVCRRCKVDAAIHMGDVLSGDDGCWYDYSVINQEMENVKRILNVAAPDASAILVGNHDGVRGSIPYTASPNNFLFGAKITRCYVEGKPKPFFYFKDSDKKIICLCLATPYYDESKTFANAWNFDSEQLNFFTNALAACDDGYHAIVFNHTSPFDYTVKDDANMISFCNVLDAFTNHASYSDASVTVDFSAKGSTKTVAWLCGHGHMDAYGVPGGWCATRDRDASAAPVQNAHAFAVVMCTISNYMYDDELVVSAGGHDVGVILKRRWGELSMFAFDTLVYQKDLGKLTLVRFGAHATSYQVDANGNREITLL